jgi:hypothetical protein
VTRALRGATGVVAPALCSAEYDPSGRRIRKTYGAASIWERRPCMSYIDYQRASLLVAPPAPSRRKRPLLPTGSSSVQLEFN